MCSSEGSEQKHVKWRSRRQEAKGQDKDVRTKVGDVPRSVDRRLVFLFGVGGRFVAAVGV
jgi:hypothetical protein